MATELLEADRHLPLCSAVPTNTDKEENPALLRPAEFLENVALDTSQENVF
jgi:hypothetical protein